MIWKWLVCVLWLLGGREDDWEAGRGESRGGGIATRYYRNLVVRDIYCRVEVVLLVV